jgi:hypothetical protein
MCEFVEGNSHIRAAQLRNAKFTGKPAFWAIRWDALLGKAFTKLLSKEEKAYDQMRRNPLNKGLSGFGTGYQLPLPAP